VWKNDLLGVKSSATFPILVDLLRQGLLDGIHAMTVAGSVVDGESYAVVVHQGGNTGRSMMMEGVLMLGHPTPPLMTTTMQVAEDVPYDEGVNAPAAVAGMVVGHNGVGAEAARSGVAAA
jgi:hypothetical protein